jgi:hypothetical protein
MSEEKDDGPTKQEEEKKSEPMTLAELAGLEEEASTRLENRLLLPHRIGNAINAAAWLFVGIGILLNIFGYDYTVKDGFLSVDTRENAAFQKELRGSSKKPPTADRGVRNPCAKWHDWEGIGGGFHASVRDDLPSKCNAFKALLFTDLKPATV